MLKIKSIDYIKVVYDESLSHNIFSIANISFSNAEDINGALLYWRKNDSKESYTKEGDYKFYYDMANTMYFAAVKFPKHVKLTRDEKQELAYILLEERGSVGSYSFPTLKKRQKPFALKKEFDKLMFPETFNSTFLPVYVKSVVPQYELEHIVQQNPELDRAFIENYAKWRYQAAQLHPEQLTPYMSYIDFRLICAINPLLTEAYLLEHFEKIDFQMLSTNYTVLKRLSEPFLDVLYSQLDTKEAIELELFLDQDEEFDDEYNFSSDEEEEYLELDYFEYDLGQYKWSGAEHLVKGIPSFAAQIYDEYGYKKKTNKEMNVITKRFNTTQWQIASATFDLHWLHRYKNEIDWSICCKDNPHLTEEFLTAHLKFVNFDALGMNMDCKLTSAFIEKYFDRFNHQYPVPVVIRHLTEQIYLQHKDTIKLNQHLLVKFGDDIDDEQFFILQAHLDEQ